MQKFTCFADFLARSYPWCISLSNIKCIGYLEVCTVPSHLSARRSQLNTAYTWYSFFEWGLILLDILYDSIVELDLKMSRLQASVVRQPSQYVSDFLLQVALGVSLDVNDGGNYTYCYPRHFV